MNIHSIILSTLLACDSDVSSTSNGTEDLTKERPTENPKRASEKKITVIRQEQESPEEKKDYHGHSGGVPHSKGHGYRPNYDATILVKHIKTMLEKSTEIDCEELCKMVGEFSFAKTIEICSYQLEEELSNIVVKENQQEEVGKLTCRGKKMSGKGRFPARLSPVLSEVDSLRKTFFEDAKAESLSVFSFLQVAIQLQHLQAPIELIDRTLSALFDEVEHAKIMLLIANNLGMESPVLPRPSFQPLEQLAFAEHNLLHGCLLEGFFALLLHRQSKKASSDSLRSIYGQLAQDEVEHAQLAWDIHRWLLPQLTGSERDVLATKWLQHIRRLPELVRSETTPYCCLGLPSEEEIMQLATIFGEHLLAA